MLESNRLDEILVILLNWLIILVCLTFISTFASWAGRQWSVASRHCLVLAIIATFLLSPLGLFVASRSGLGYVDLNVFSQASGIEGLSFAKSGSSGPNIEGQLRERYEVTKSEDTKSEVAQAEVVESEVQSMADSLVDGKSESDSLRSSIAVSAPVLDTWILIVRVVLVFAGTVWCIGSCVFFLKLVLSLRLLLVSLKGLDLVEDPGIVSLTLQTQKQIGFRGDVSIFQTSTTSVPISFGILSSMIVLPESFANRFSQAQQRSVLLHEMAHLDRRDSYVGLLQEVCKVFYWWHPWILRRSKELDQLREILCDRRVVEIEGDGRALAEALLQSAQLATETRLRLPCLSTVGREVGDIAQRLQVLCNVTQLNLHPITSMKRLGIQLTASLCLVVTSIPILRGQPTGDEREPNVAGDQDGDAIHVDPNPEGAKKTLSRTDDEWIALLVAAVSHNPVAFEYGPQIVALDRDRSLSIVENSWPQIQIGEVKTGILKAFQFYESPDVLAVLHLGMTDSNPAVQDYARDYLCYWALQMFERNSQDYAVWYASHRSQSLNEVLRDGYRQIAQSCEKLPPASAIQKFQELERSIDDKWKPSGSQVRSEALKESGIGAFPIEWIRSNTLDQTETEFACKLLRQIPGRPSESVNLLKSWIDTKESLTLRTSAAIALAELDRDAAIDAMLIMIEEVTRSKPGDNMVGFRMRDELCRQLAELGEPRVIPELIAIMECDNSRETIGTIDGALTMSRLGQVWVKEELRPMRDGQWWIRWWERNRQRMPEPLPQVNVRDIPKTEFGKTYVPYPADMDTFEGLRAYLERELQKDSPNYFGLGYLFSMQRDPRAIPVLIGVIDADNSYDTVYGLGYYGLGFYKGFDLTGVKYSPYHDGAWWRRWWEANKERFPLEAQAIPIPDYPKSNHGKSYRPFPANMDTFEGRVDYLRRELAIANAPLDSASEALESISDPRAIATLIGVWVACYEAEMMDEKNVLVRPLYNVLEKEKQFDMQAIMDAQWTARWWRDWYRSNRSKIQGLENYDLPDFQVELSKRAGI